MTRACCDIARGSGARFCGVCGRRTETGRRSRLGVHDEAAALGPLVVVALAVLALLPYAKAANRATGRVIEDEPSPEAEDRVPWDEPEPAVGGGEAPAPPDLQVGAERGDEPGASPVAVEEDAEGSGEGDTNRVVSELLRAWRAPAAGGSDEDGEAPSSGPAGSAGDGPSVRLRPFSVTASSFTFSTGPNSYQPGNAIDGDRATGWQVSDRGVGQWIRLLFEEEVVLDRIGVVPGYDKVVADRFGDRWPLNNRVSDVQISWEGGSVLHHFADDRSVQWVNLGSVRTRWVRIEITGTYPGSRWNDTVISEIECEGREPLRS